MKDENTIAKPYNLLILKHLLYQLANAVGIIIKEARNVNIYI
jgi:hypothetical protein